MSSNFTWHIGRSAWIGLFLGVALVPALLIAADRPGKAAPPADTPVVDLFDGIHNGDLGVRFVAKDSREARITIENKTKRPLSVKLPEAFAGVPVLAQVGAGGAGGARGGGQGVGGGVGGGLAYIAPEKVESLKVPTVCLEHGKPEPHPTMPYEIKPLESFTEKPGVRELCRMLGAGQMNQRVAQAAAWHLNSGLSWEQLATKPQRRANGTSQPYFNMAEIRAAMQATAAAVQAAQQSKPVTESASAGVP